MNINGLMVDAPKYSTDTKSKIVETLVKLRPSIFLPDDAERGFRFDSDDHVIWLLESGATESEVNSDVDEACRLALIEAGRSDYWYAHEKDWE